MVQNDFAQMVKNELKRRGFEVIIAPVLKNNSLKLTLNFAIVYTPKQESLINKHFRLRIVPIWCILYTI